MVDGVAGTVTYDTVNNIAAFKPLSDFAPNTTYNARVTTGATDLNGTALAAPVDFSFTTRPERLYRRTASRGTREQTMGLPPLEPAEPLNDKQRQSQIYKSYFCSCSFSLASAIALRTSARNGRPSAGTDTSPKSNARVVTSPYHRVPGITVLAERGTC